MRRLIIIASLLLVVSCNQGPNTFEQAIEQQKQNNPAALSRIIKFAENGDYRAQLWLGRYYSQKEHKDQLKSATYFKLAADQGDLDGMYFTGENHLSGEGLPRNEETSMSYLLAAANSNQLAAIVELSNIYRKKYEESWRVGQPSGSLWLAAISWNEKSFAFGYSPGAVWMQTLWANAPQSQGYTVRKVIIQQAKWQHAYSLATGKYPNKEGDLFKLLNGKEKEEAQDLGVLAFGIYKTLKPAETYLNISKIYVY